MRILCRSFDKKGCAERANSRKRRKGHTDVSCVERSVALAVRCRPSLFLAVPRTPCLQDPNAATSHVGRANATRGNECLRDLRFWTDFRWSDEYQNLLATTLPVIVRISLPDLLRFEAFAPLVFAILLLIASLQIPKTSSNQKYHAGVKFLGTHRREVERSPVRLASPEQSVARRALRKILIREPSYEHCSVSD